jgi:peptidoglycan-associated lipoprotein
VVKYLLAKTKSTLHIPRLSDIFSQIKNKMQKQTSILLLCLLTACNYTIKIRDGQTAYDRKQYATALPMLEKEFKRAESRVERGKKAFLIGECLKNTGKYAETIRWYETAYENSFGSEALKAKAYMLKQTEQYTEAQAAFKLLGQEVGSQYEYRKEITACQIVEAWKKGQDSTEWQISIAHSSTPANEFSPLPGPNGRMLFTSDRAIGRTSKSNYAWTQKPFFDIYSVEPDDASAQLFDQELSTPAHESHLCFSPDGQEVWFNRSVPSTDGADHFMQIFYAKRKESGWSIPEALSFQKQRINYLHPALAPDGKSMIFSTTDGLHGGYDLCISQREGMIGWSDPVPLPRVVNSMGNDVFPVWHKDTLYFSSTGHTGMGGLDIFKTWRMDAKTWAPPINLKAPVNSGFDDFGFWVRKQYEKVDTVSGAMKAEGFFSSNRPGGKGGDDIYAWTLKVPQKPIQPIVIVDTLPQKKLGRIILEVVVLEKIFADSNDPNSKLVGRKPIQGAKLELMQNNKLILSENLKDGVYSMQVKAGQTFGIRAMSEGFLTGSALASTIGFADANTEDQRLEIEVILDKVYKDREIVLENIYYDYDKAEIRQDAEPTLNKLAETLTQNPKIKIQLGSHTDCRGVDRYNRELSQRRAQSAVNYLISKDIDPSRLSAVGYGETAPIASCGCSTCSEAEHQMNRRTTFRIVE